MTPRRAVPWGTISRDKVVDAALTIVKRDGYDQLTIRGLARELGVAPMSLYSHVRDKDDLLNEVVDRLLRRSWRPRVAEADWRAYIGQACDRLRGFLVAQPAALHVYLHRPVVTPTALERMRSMLRVLEQAGFDEVAAHGAYAVLQTYTIGFAALEASRAGWAPSDDDAAVAYELAAYSSPRQFGEGLRHLLDGLEGEREQALV